MALNLIQPRLDSLRQRFGESHLALACHAALPLALTPDLLYCLWANFQRDIQGEALDIPWVAVSDLLLSGLWEEMGHELYELDRDLRDELLTALKENPRFGPRRLYELTEFVLAYGEQMAYKTNQDDQDFVEAQRWVALAYQNPGEAAHSIALALTRLPPGEGTSWIRMASLLKVVEQPLGEEFSPLVSYAQGMAQGARGDWPGATAQIRPLLDQHHRLQVAQVDLPVPEVVKPAPSPDPAINLARRRFLRLAALGGLGLGGAILLERSIRLPQPNYHASPKPSPQPSPQPSSQPTVVSLRPFEFKVVTVNPQGRVLSEQLQQGQLFTERLGPEVGIEMVVIPQGEFLMGSPQTEVERSAAEGPQHRVTVPGFYLGRYEVTQAQWRSVAALPKVNWDLQPDPSRFKGDNLPVETVTWEDAIEFCDRLSRHTNRLYRLPSEAEWEYACRAGTTTPFHFGETITSKLANYYSEAAYGRGPTGKYRGKTTPVGSFPANAFGLSDMHGNVWEWCADPWHDSYKNAPADGSSWELNENNSARVLRGGSWVDYPRNCRCAGRGRGTASGTNSDWGFRLACSSSRT